MVVIGGVPFVEREYASWSGGVKFLCSISTRHHGGMSGFDSTWLGVLAESIETARTALRDIDDAELTPPLRRVAASQGGRLPPPLALRLLRELDENEWFRDKVAEAWQGDPAAPGGLFLVRPDGWWVELGAAVAGAAGAVAQQRVAALEMELKSVATKRDVAVAKVKELKKAVDESRREAKKAVGKARQTSESRYEKDLTAVADLHNELDEATQHLQAMVDEHLALQDAFAALRARFAKARKGRVEESDQPGGSRSVPADPVKLARMLDLQAASFGRDLAEPVALSAADTEPLALGTGIRPDSSDAIRWLVGLDEPVAVLVDGYNAQFHIDRDDFTSGAARRRLVEALKRLRSSADVKHRIVVIYDSTLPGERIARTSAGGVEIRFAEEDRIADEEIVEMTAALRKSVVISSDRAVREGSEGNGAVVLWSEALQSWLDRT